MSSARLPLLAALCICSGNAFPSFCDQIPNGRRVPCPSGVDGCDAGDVSQCQPAAVCNGVGHGTCKGGTMPLNVFGEALRDAGYTWTKELCEADSDGDGLSNGEELGDPCCLWRAGDALSTYMSSFMPTHPGFPDAPTVASAYSKPACADTVSIHQGLLMGKYNDGEEQRTVEMRIKNYSIPAARTTYVDIALNFPIETFTGADIFHIVRADAIVDRQRNLHHYLLHGCRSRFPEQLDGKVVSKNQKKLANCDVDFGGWVPGTPIYAMVPWVGVEFGPQAGIVALVLNVHYDNQPQASGIVDSSGIRFSYTPTLRDYTMSSMETMKLSNNRKLVVPAGMPRWFVTRRCALTVVDPATRAPSEMHLSHVGFHAHLLGREMYMELLRDGESIPIDLGSEPIWHFDDQYRHPIADWNLTLRSGDVLQTTCVMSSEGRSERTIFGKETTDEMCWGLLQGWSNRKGHKVSAKCEGEAWTGQLDAQEPGFGLAERHPMALAPDVFDMSSMLSGGKSLRLDGVDQKWCRDTLGDRCVTTASTYGCYFDLGSVNKLAKGKTIIDICCKTACDTVCTAHARCKLAKQGGKTTQPRPKVAPRRPYSIKEPRCSFRTLLVYNGDDPISSASSTTWPFERLSVQLLLAAALLASCA